jgi:hypothetical protein
MTDYNQREVFRDYVLGIDLLDNAIYWIGKNLDPDDVFSDDSLNTWARGNYDPEEALEVSDIIRLAKDNCNDPEEIFDKDRLETWALDNGWVHFG